MAKAKILKSPDPATEKAKDLLGVVLGTETRMICLKALMEDARDEDRYGDVLTFLDDIIIGTQDERRRAETRFEVTEKGPRALEEDDQKEEAESFLYPLSIQEADDITDFQMAMNAFMDVLDGERENTWFLLKPHWCKFDDAFSSARERWLEQRKAEEGGAA